MRTDTFFAARAAIFPMMVLLLWGTPTCVSQTVDGSSAAAIAQQPASPLSQYANPNEVIDFHNRRPGVSLEDGEVVVTKTIDLRNTLQKYAQIKNCSLDQAFSDTVSYLKMQPLQDNDAGRIIGTQAFYSIVEKDKYRITAPRKFFARLEEDLLCLENGKRHVLLDVHFLKVTTTQIENLQTHLVPGSYVAFSNKFPEVIPYATQASIKDSEQWRTQHPEAKGTFVVASETKTKIYPTFLGRLTDQGVASLLKSLKSDVKSEIMLAPRMKIVPGQTATVTDAATRPYVVGVNRIEGDFTVAHQPIVQSVEDGVILKLRPTGEGNEIRIDGDLALCEISSVGTFQLPSRKGQQDNAVTVQVPEQKLKQVHWSTCIKEGETLLIDPVFEKFSAAEPTEKGRKNFTGHSKSRVIVLIKPRFVESETAAPR